MRSWRANPSETRRSTCFHLDPHRLPVALMLPSRAFGQLNVGWSLYVEMVASMLFPLLAWSGRRGSLLVPLGLAIALLGVTDPSFRALRYLFDFALGLTASAERARIARFMEHAPRLLFLAAAAAPVFLLQRPIWAAALASGESEASATSLLSFGLGSALLVVMSVHIPTLRRWLSSTPAVFFGRISYSLYLVHLPILAALICRSGRPLVFAPGSGVLLFAITLGLSTFVAMLGWRLVEEPAIRAGRAVIRAGIAFRARFRTPDPR